MLAAATFTSAYDMQIISLHPRLLEFKLYTVLFTMYHPSFKKNYQSPANIDSFDVGISYKSEIDEDLLVLYNDYIQESEVQLPLDDQEKCVYKIYFKNNTSRLCEVKIFISNSPNEYEITGEPSNHLEKTGEHSNHLILKPDISYYIERPDKVYRKYTFVAEESKIFKEIVGSPENYFNSYVTVKVYPEKRQFHQFSTSSMCQGSNGLKVETDFGGYRKTKECFGAASAGPTNSSITDCFGSALAEPAKSGVNLKYKISKGETPITVGGVTVLGEKSNQVFYKAPLLVKEGSSFTYKFKLTGHAKLNFIPLNPIIV